jgi:hypothetical protein
VDIAQGEMVEKELDNLITRRSRRKDPEEEHDLWNASVRAYEERRRRMARLEGTHFIATRLHATAPRCRR